jgi:hypothetical protein
VIIGQVAVSTSQGRGTPIPRALQPGVPCVQGGSQRYNAGHDGRTGVLPHPARRFDTTVAPQKRTICPVLGPFSGEDIRDFLGEYGYTSNPKGLAQPFPVDFIAESKGEAYLDVNAEAVRKGDEVPDRPVRISFHKIFDGAVTSWRLKSVEELAPGVNSTALDRSKDTPKTSPWPETMPQDDSTVA